MSDRTGHVLIADDEPQVLKLYKKILIEGGYEVSTVTSGRSALEIVSKTRVDLLVLDLSMPQPDGFEVLRLLRVSQPGLRILVISGFMHGALLEASQFLGATAYLSKDEAPKKLLEIVDSLLK